MSLLSTFSGGGASGIPLGGIFTAPAVVNGSNGQFPVVMNYTAAQYVRTGYLVDYTSNHAAAVLAAPHIARWGITRAFGGTTATMHGHAEKRTYVFCSDGAGRICMLATGNIALGYAFVGTSLDDINYVTASGSFASQYDHQFNMVSGGGGGFIVGIRSGSGFHSFYTSTNGTTWTQRGSTNSDGACVAYNGTRWLQWTGFGNAHYRDAANPDGTWTSTAGVTNPPSNGPSPTYYGKYVGGNGVFVNMHYYSPTGLQEFKTSTDGLAWTTRTLPSNMTLAYDDTDMTKYLVLPLTLVYDGGSTFRVCAVERRTGEVRLATSTDDGATFTLGSSTVTYYIETLPISTLAPTSKAAMETNRSGTLILTFSAITDRQALISRDSGATWNPLQTAHSFDPLSAAYGDGLRLFDHVTYDSYTGTWYMQAVRAANAALMVGAFTNAQLASTPQKVGIAGALTDDTVNYKYVRTR